MWAHTHTERHNSFPSFLHETRAGRNDKHGRDTGFISRTAMLLQKSRPFKGRLARSPLTKDVLIIFTAAEIKKIDMFPFAAQPQATEFATTKQKSILPHNTVFLGGWKPRSPHPKKVVPQQTLRLKRRLDNCYFCSSSRYEASLVQSLQTLGQKSKCRIEKIEAQPVDLKMGFCTIRNKTQPVATEPGKGERTMGRGGSWRFIQETDSMFASPPCLASCRLLAFHMRPRDTVHVFYLFVTFRNISRGSAWFEVNTVFLHPLPLLPKQRGGVWSALCWPSGKLHQTHLIQAEITGRPRRACVDESLRFKCCQMPAIHLTKSEQSLTASSKRH